MSEIAPVVLITVLLLVVAAGIVVLVLVYQKKQLQYINERAQMKASFDKEILESKLEIQEQTMKHIAQEVHDNIGQVLSVAKLNISSMNGNTPEPLLKEKIDIISVLVSKAIQDLRHLSKSLNNDIISERGLLQAIEYEFEILKKSGEYKTTMNIEGEHYHLPEQKELIVFRIFQEVMNNIIKHAQASRIHARIRFLPKKFFFEISDNGQGFDTNQYAKSNGSGIRNIKNRSRLIEAGCNINSQPGNGTTITIELPVKNDMPAV